MPKINFAVDVAFEVVGEYESFEDVPYPVILAAMQKRLDSLKLTPDKEAFDCFDQYEIE